MKGSSRFGLSFIDFFHQFHNLFVVGTNFFYLNIMVDDIDDTSKIFAHVCFNIIFFCE